MIQKWPHYNEIYTDILAGDFVSVDCMSESLTFFTPSSWKKGDNGKVMDTFWFLAEFDLISVP